MSTDEPDTPDLETPDVQATPEEPETGRQYTLRRAPRYLSFGLTGVVIGVVAGLVIGSLPSEQVLDRQTYTSASVLGYFVVAFGLFGTLLGLGAALLLERRRR